MQQTLTQHPRRTSGFSLIEVLVSMTIFTIVVTIATSTLLVLIDANAKALNKQTILSNFTFALDSMSREIRTGYNYFCKVVPGADVNTQGANAGNPQNGTATQSCTNDNFISFIESGDSLTTGSGSDKRISYLFDPNDNGGRGVLYRRLGDQDWYPISDENITFDEFFFTVDGTNPLSAGHTGQAYVTIFVSGRAGDFSTVDASFNIQTTVTQRVLDL